MSTFNKILGLVIVNLSIINALYSTHSEIVELTRDNFQQVYSQKDIWIVDFYAPWSDQSLQFVQTFIKLSTVVRGMAVAASFNADTRHYFAKQMGITSIPVLKFYGINHNSTDYVGKRTVEALTGATLVALQRKVNYRQDIPQRMYKQIVVKLIDENFDDHVLMSDLTWLVEFFSPSCGITRTFSPKFEKLCRKLRSDGIVCAVVDIEKNLKTKQELKIQTQPTFLYFHRGLKSKYSYETYKGPLDPVDILDWVLTTYNETIPIPTLYQLVDEVVLRKACEAPALCIVLILPKLEVCDPTCRYKYFNMMFHWIRVFKLYPWGWVWFETGTQPFIESLVFNFETKVPRVVAVNYRKKEYMVTKTPFEETESFLKRVSMDTSVKRELKTSRLPKINTIPLWDGEGNIVNKDEL